MGNAIYCDRCKKLFDANITEMKKVRISGVFNETYEADMCEDCARSVEDWANGKDLEKEKKRAK